MTTVKDTIISAYRRSGVNAAGRRPTSLQMDIGLELFQGWYNKMVGDGLFGRLCDIYLSTDDDYTAAENQRIYVSVSPTTVILPTFVTTDPNFANAPPGQGRARQPLDLSLVVVVDPTIPSSTTSIYDRNFGKWFTITELGQDDQAPLSARFEEGLKNILAVLLADENGYTVRPLLARNAGLARLSIASNYGGERTPAKGDYY